MTLTFYVDLEPIWVETDGVIPRASESVLITSQGKPLEAKVLKVVHNYLLRTVEVYLASG